MKEEFREEIDPLLASAYAELRAETVEVDWDRLQRAIGERAKPVLARGKVRGLIRVARPLVPMAIAASVAFGLWIGPAYVREYLAPAPTEVAADLNMEEILVQAVDGSVSDQEFRLLVTGRSNPDALLAFAVSAR